MTPYLKIALRNLHREKLYALVNTLGLALAFACCIVLGLYLRSELSYDRHHENHERIYRLVNMLAAGANPQTLAVTSPIVAPMMAEAYPEISAFVRFIRASGQGDILFTHGTDAAYWDDVYAVDANVFEVFTHKAVFGDTETAFADMSSSIAVSESFARHYFGDENPIGQTVEIAVDDDGDVSTITLVFEDLPANTHLKYDVLIPLNASRLTPENEFQRVQRLWDFGNFIYSYFVMPEDYDVRDFEAISQDFFERNMKGVADSVGGTWRGWLEPLADIHLQSDLLYDRPTGNPYYVYGFAAVAIFILIVASINYVNLATARALRRARSVGMRKILGANRFMLVLQFLGEAVLFALIATVIGVVIVEVALTLTPLEALLGTPIDVDLLGEPGLAATIAAAGLLVGLLAGLYPAVYLSGWAPLSALVTTTRSARGSYRFRQVLVFLQFAISIAVIASALIMAAQMRYIQNKSLGFEPENRVMITLRGTDLIRRTPVITNELSALPGVLGVADTTIIMGQDLPAGSPIVESNAGAMERFNSGIMFVGERFLEVMGARVVAGRDFSTRLLTDVGTRFVVNEKFVRERGWDEPLGKQMSIGTDIGRVIGVVEDFNFKSLHDAIEPIAITLQPELPPEANERSAQRILVVNIAGDALAPTLRLLEQKFAELDPRQPFAYQFVDEFIGAQYASEQSLMRLVALFAGICILIACLGTYGLAAFATEERTKEIGIRKVLGATGGQIVLLLSRNILVMILAGAVFASLAAWLAMDIWLENFAYQVTINPLLFVVATGVALALAFATVAVQSLGTTMQDPALALRHE
jgi:putative ABC transport system permease protein